MALTDYSTTASANATVGSVNFAENQSAASVNDSARVMMADLKAGAILHVNGASAIKALSGSKLSDGVVVLDRSLGLAYQWDSSASYGIALTDATTGYFVPLGSYIDVTALEADPTGSSASSTAFTTALANYNVVIVPPGTYLVEDVTLSDGKAIISPGGFWGRTILKCTTAGTGGSPKSVFKYASVANIFLYGLTFDTNAEYVYGIYQTNRANHTANSRIQNCEFRTSLTRGFSGFPILTDFERCRFGYTGTAPTATHQAIYAVPATNGQANQTNMVRLKDCNVYSADNATAAIEVEWGDRWDFENVNFEDLSTYAVKLSGVRRALVKGCWLEDVTGSYMFQLALDGGSNQGTDLTIENTKLVCTNTTSAVVLAADATSVGFRDVELTSCASGFKLSKFSTYENVFLTEVHNVTAASGAGSADVLPLVRNGMSVLPVSQETFSTGDWTKVSSSSTLAAGTSVSGLMTNSLDFDLDADGSGLYIDIPSNLISLLTGYYVSWVVVGHGDGSTNNVEVAAAVWDSVGSPAYNNYTAIGAQTISSGDSDLEISWLDHQITSSTTSLRFGIQCGGVASSPTLSIEKISLVVGRQPLLS